MFRAFGNVPLQEPTVNEVFSSPWDFNILTKGKFTYFLLFFSLFNEAGMESESVLLLQGRVLNNRKQFVKFLMLCLFIHQQNLI
jgi:hypothetical protein